MQDLLVANTIFDVERAINGRSAKERLANLSAQASITFTAPVGEVLFRKKLGRARLQAFFAACRLALSGWRPAPARTIGAAMFRSAAN